MNQKEDVCLSDCPWDSSAKTNESDLIFLFHLKGYLIESILIYVSCVGLRFHIRNNLKNDIQNRFRKMEKKARDKEQREDEAVGKNFRPIRLTGMEFMKLKKLISYQEF